MLQFDVNKSVDTETTDTHTYKPTGQIVLSTFYFVMKKG